MALTSVNSYLTGAKRDTLFYKDPGTTGWPATRWLSLFDAGGYPLNGTLAVGNTTTGIVPVPNSAIPTLATGYLKLPPLVNPTAQITSITYGHNVPCRLALFDTLYSIGALGAAANLPAIVSPSWASRIQSTDDYNDLEIWVEIVTNITGTPVIAVGVKDKNGTSVPAGTPSTLVAAPKARSMFQLSNPSKNGISAITTILESGGITAGTFNIHVMRRLWQGRVQTQQDETTDNYLQLGMPTVYPNSCLRCIIAPDSGTIGRPHLHIEVTDA